jgi:hypothetical protein
MPEEIEGEAHEVDERGGQVAVAPPPPAAPLPAPYAPPTPAVLGATMDIELLVSRMEAVKAAMEKVMEEEVHYGQIAGMRTPVLLKPGAEVLCVLFQLAPRYTKVERYGPGDHYSVDVNCSLWHQPTGTLVAEGLGSCTTREKKYGERTARRTCPTCGEPQINYSTRDNEFYCWRKKGGCGATFPKDDARITTQEEGTQVNPDLPDTWNTVLKMGCKRALIAGVLNATGASALFTQDLEDGAATGNASEGGDPFTNGEVQPAATVKEGVRSEQPSTATGTTSSDGKRTDEDGGVLLPAKDYLRDMLGRWPGWDWVEQARQACDHVYGPAPSLAARPLPDAIAIAERMYRVRKFLEQNSSDLGFQPIELQAVWATCFDGAEVEPVYTPTEQQQASAAAGAAIVEGLRESGALRTGTEVAAANAADPPVEDDVPAWSTPLSEEEQQELDEIPFGPGPEAPAPPAAASVADDSSGA